MVHMALFGNVGSDAVYGSAIAIVIAVVIPLIAFWFRNCFSWKRDRKAKASDINLANKSKVYETKLKALEDAKELVHRIALFRLPSTQSDGFQSPLERARFGVSCLHDTCNAFDMPNDWFTKLDAAVIEVDLVYRRMSAEGDNQEFQSWATHCLYDLADSGGLIFQEIQRKLEETRTQYQNLSPSF